DNQTTQLTSNSLGEGSEVPSPAQLHSPVESEHPDAGQVGVFPPGTIVEYQEEGDRLVEAIVTCINKQLETNPSSDVIVRVQGCTTEEQVENIDQCLANIGTKSKATIDLYNGVYEFVMRSLKHS